MKILKAYNIPPKMLSAINLLHENTIITPDGETEYFEIKAGVLQGDTLAPYLFAIVLDYIMRKTYDGREEEIGFQLHSRRSQRNPATTTTDLDFADDIAVLAEEIEQAQEILSCLEHEAEGVVGLYCNAKKTELQIFNHDSPVEIRVKDGKTLKIVENIKYLGGMDGEHRKRFCCEESTSMECLPQVEKRLEF